MKTRIVLENELYKFPIFYQMLEEQHGINTAVQIKKSMNNTIDPQ